MRGTMTDDLGKLLLRVTVGGLMLMYGIHKINNGVDFVEDMLTAKGLGDYTWLRYGLYAGEVAAPAALILGILPRLAAFGIAATMGMALWLSDDYQSLIEFQLNGHGGLGAERPVFFLLASLAIVFMGGGRWGILADRDKSLPPI